MRLFASDGIWKGGKRRVKNLAQNRNDMPPKHARGSRERENGSISSQLLRACPPSAILHKRGVKTKNGNSACIPLEEEGDFASVRVTAVYLPCQPQPFIPPATVYIPSLEEEEEEEAVTRTGKLVGWGTKKKRRVSLSFPPKK